MFEGDAGIGKTALLDFAATADGFCVLRVIGVQSDASLGFGGLLEMARPVIGFPGAVPGPQADAVRAALGLAAPAWLG